jgi:aerobic-type carbon monoxide dehydrogenase small subunit (CoxS/CutS family)
MNARSDTMITLNVNGKPRKLDAPDDMPLLWALRDILGMEGTKFGCGLGLCGACTVHINGVATRSCITPIAAVRRKGDHDHRGRGQHARRSRGAKGLACW